MKTLFVVTLAGVLFSSQAISGNRFCSGTIDEIGLGKWGDSLYLYSKSIFGDDDGRKMCQIGFNDDATNYKSISGEMCKLWYSTMLSAFMSGKEIKFDYDTANNSRTCHERSTWQNFIPPIQIIIR